jgi:hypothetical protein
MRLRAAGMPLVLGLLVPALLAGCGSPSGPGAVGAGPSLTDSPLPSTDPASASDTASTEDSATTSEPSTSSFVTVQPRTSQARPSTISVPAAGLAPCAPPYLKLTAGRATSGSGHAGYVLIFTNTGQIACAMTGYPAVAILDARDRQIIKAARTPNGYLGGLRHPKPALPATGLGPGGVASALLEGMVFDPTSTKGCPIEHALLGTAPSTTSPIKLVATTVICSQVQIHPVVPGTSGSQP